MTVETKIVTHRSDKMALRVTPDGKFAAIYHNPEGFRAGNIKVYNLNEFTSLRYRNVWRYKDLWNDDELTSTFDISPDGRYVALTYTQSRVDGHDGMGLYVWDVKNENYLPVFDASNVEYRSYIALGVDGRRGYDIIDVRFINNDLLLETSASGEVFVWSILRERLVWFVGGAAHLADSVAFSHKMGLFAVSEQTILGRGGQIGKFHTVYDKIFSHFRGYRNYEPVGSYEILNIGKYFRLWNVYNGTLIREFECDSEVNHLVFSRDDNLIAGSIHKVTHLWDVNTGHQVDVLPSNTVPIGFTSDNKYLVAQFGHNKIGMWNIEKMEWHQLYELNGFISSAQLIDNNKVVALSQTLDEWLIHQIQLEL